MTQMYNFTKTQLNTTINQMHLSIRATNALIQNKIITLRDLLKVLETTGLAGLHNLGKISINEIMKKLDEMDTTKYSDTESKIREFESKAEEIKEEKAWHNAELAKLNNRQNIYAKRIELLKRQR